MQSGIQFIVVYYRQPGSLIRTVGLRHGGCGGQKEASTGIESFGGDSAGHMPPHRILSKTIREIAKWYLKSTHLLLPLVSHFPTLTPSAQEHFAEIGIQDFVRFCGKSASVYDSTKTNESEAF